MDKIKSLFIKLFFGDKFIKKISTTVAAVLFSYLASYIPGAPEVVKLALEHLFDLPPGTVLDEAGFIAAVAPLLAIIFDYFVKGIIAKDNNEALAIIQHTVVEGEPAYDGPLDAWVGPNAKRALHKIVDALSNIKG